MATFVSILLLVVLFTCSPAIATEDHNYMSMSNVFASIAGAEDIILPEIEIMKNLEGLKNQLAESSKILDRYINNWKESNMAAALEEGDDALELFLKKRRKIPEFDNLIDNDDGEEDDGEEDDVVHISEKNATELKVDLGNSTQNVTYDPLYQNIGSKIDKKENEMKQINTNIVSDLKPDIKISMIELMNHKKDLPNGAGLHHPIDGYLLMKRLSVDWKPVNDTLFQLYMNTSSLLAAISSDRKKYSFPQSADLNGAAVAIVRLQNLYDISLKKLGAGIIKKKYTYGEKDLKSMGKLRPWDFVLLGKQAYQLGFGKRAIEWFKFAVEISTKFDLNEDEKDLIPSLTKTILRHDNFVISKKPKKKPKKVPATLMKPLLRDVEVHNQNRLCAGETLMSIEEESKLQCSYEKVSLYFTLMPLKVEVVHDVPRVVLIHNFLSDNKTNYIRKKAKPHLSPSTHGKVNGIGNSMIRVSMTTWLNDLAVNSSDYIKKMTKKIEATTGMNALTYPYSSEYLQVVNYGIGGLYEHHVDYGVNNKKDKFDDRLVTFLIYLADVMGGGATVFTRLGIKVQPKKGMALMWYNLRKSGSYDNLMYHAACPVLHGSKWIATKWIRYTSQVFKQPCGLREDERFTFP